MHLQLPLMRITGLYDEGFCMFKKNDDYSDQTFQFQQCILGLTKQDL